MDNFTYWLPQPGKGDRSMSIIHAELAIDMLGMQLDCSGRDHQFAISLL